MAKPLGSLEAAGLAAGVSRPTLSRYIRACRIYEDSHRVLDGTQRFIDQLAATISEQAQEIQQNGKSEAVVASVKSIKKNAETIGNKATELENPVSQLHDVALEELGMALWHPVVLRVHWRKLRQTRKLADTTEESSRNLATALRRIEGLGRHIVPAGRKFRAKEVVGVGHSAIPIDPKSDSSSA